MKLPEICCIAVSLVLMSSVALPVLAVGNSVSKTEIFYSENKEQKHDFPAEIEQDGNKYSLADVSYRILSEKPEIENVRETSTTVIENLYSKSVSEIPQTKTITVDGKDYQAKFESVSYENMIIKNRQADVQTTLNLTENEIKDSILYEYNDTDTGNTVQVTLHKKSVSDTGEVRKKSVEFPVVFHRYDSEQFLINGKLVTVNRGDPPVLKEYFGDVKAESNYANSNGEVTDIRWNGLPYTFNGEALRNATATLTEAFKVYAVNYSDTVKLPDTEGYRAILSYCTDVPEPTGIVTYEIEATANYYLVPKDYTGVFVGIGILIMAIVLAAVLVVIVRKKKNQGF